MIDFGQLTTIVGANDGFVGIRKASEGSGYEMCLPYGFEAFAGEDYDQVRDFFFKMYRTFGKFERENRETGRFSVNTPDWQKDQDQTTVSGGGAAMVSEDGETCVLYSKIRMIERVLESYDDLAIQSIQRKLTRSEHIDYSKMHRYLHRAVYLPEDVIYLETMDMPRTVVRYGSTDIVDLYCYILDEIVQQLQEDVPERIKANIQDIRFLSQRFRENYLTGSQSIFDRETFRDTMSVLKEALDSIDKHTAYKDVDYWGLYEAIETFLYGELNPNQDDGDFWGIKGFSPVWEDICNAYVFDQWFTPDNETGICYADSDIRKKGYRNSIRLPADAERVGNHRTHDGSRSWSPWIYRKTTTRTSPAGDTEMCGWDELLCIEYLQPPSGNGQLRRFPRPDLVLFDGTKVTIIDFKNVPDSFFSITPPPEKLRIDVAKQLMYEYALQQSKKVESNIFLIPWYTEEEREIASTEIGGLRGIKVVKANFYKFLKAYLAN